MRRKLAELKNKNYTFQATVKEVLQESILLNDVFLYPEHEYITDHLWIPTNKKTEYLCLSKGDQIQFNGRKYIYARANGTMDYGICNIRKMVVLNTSVTRMIDISIIVPVGSVDRTILDRCLGSIQNQTRIEEHISNSERVEVLVMDYGNEPYIKATTLQHKNYCFYEKCDHSNLFDAINKGVEKASGEYIMFLMPEAMLTKDALRDLAIVADEYNSDLFCFRKTKDYLEGNSQQNNVVFDITNIQNRFIGRYYFSKEFDYSDTYFGQFIHHSLLDGKTLHTCYREDTFAFTDLELFTRAKKKNVVMLDKDIYISPSVHSCIEFTGEWSQAKTLLKQYAFYIEELDAPKKAIVNKFLAIMRQVFENIILGTESDKAKKEAFRMIYRDSYFKTGSMNFPS